MNPIPKPNNWDSLQSYQKISIYKNFLGNEVSSYVDKISAKDIASSFGVKVAPLVRVLNDVNDISQEDLKEGWILKASHGCQWNIWLHPSLNLNTVKQKLNEWNRPYRPAEEPHYKHIVPRFFIEERIVDKCLGTKGSLVYHIRCMYGITVPMIRVRNGDIGNVYDMNWNHLEIPELNFPVPKPVHLNKLFEFASKMSKLFEFVRMDFYIDEHDDIYFSEYTFTPKSGYSTELRSLEVTSSRYWTRTIKPC